MIQTGEIMDYFYLALTSVALAGSNIVGGFYNKKEGTPLIYNIAVATAAAIFFLIASGFKFSVSGEMFLYSVLFGICYAVFFLSQLKSIKEGSVSLTALVTSYSLILPTLFGIFAYKEYPSYLFYIGFALFLVSLCFIVWPRDKNTLKITKKWVFYVTLAFLSNGFCSVFLNAFQKKSGGAQKCEFMLFAMLVAIVISVVALLVNKDKTRLNVKRTVVYGGICGIMNATVNFLAMVLAVSAIPLSVIYPTLSAGSLVLSTLISAVAFKEKPDMLGIIGIVLSVAALILMNI